jgi:hypothetical protein
VRELHLANDPLLAETVGHETAVLDSGADLAGDSRDQLLVPGGKVVLDRSTDQIDHADRSGIPVRRCVAEGDRHEGVGIVPVRRRRFAGIYIAAFEDLGAPLAEDGRSDRGAIVEADRSCLLAAAHRCNELEVIQLGVVNPECCAPDSHRIDDFTKDRFGCLLEGDDRSEHLADRIEEGDFLVTFGELSPHQPGFRVMLQCESQNGCQERSALRVAAGYLDAGGCDVRYGDGDCGGARMIA